MYKFHLLPTRLSIGTKLLSGFLLVVLLLGVLGVQLTRTLNGARHAFVLIDHRVDDLSNIDALRRLHEQEVSSLTNYLVTEDPAWGTSLTESMSLYDLLLSDLNASMVDSSSASALSLYEHAVEVVRAASSIVRDHIQSGQIELAHEVYDEVFLLDEARASALIVQLTSEMEDEISTLLWESKLGVLAGGNAFVLAAIILISIIGIFAFYLTVSITHAIENLHRTVEKIIAGDLDERAAVGTRDEIGELASAFNVMTEKLHTSYEMVEQKVIRKTKELRETVEEVGEKNTALKKSKTALVEAMHNLQIEKNHLAHAKAKDDAILSSIGDGLLVTDAGGVITLTNARALEMLGFELKEVMDQDFLDIIELHDHDSDDSVRVARPFQEVLREGKRITVTNYSYKRKDGSLIPVAITVAPIRHDGRTVGVVNIFRDITREREIDKAKTEFVSLASHQLRSPLTAIKWYLEMLAGGVPGPLTDDQKDYVKDISENTQYMIDLVSKLLNVSRIDLGTFVIEPKMCDLRDLANDILKKLDVQREQREVTIQKDFPGVMKKISVDPKLMRIVFQNLFSNAIKYSKPKGVVRLAIKQTASELIFSVEDHGYGIPKEEQFKIFGKLFRASNVQEEQIEGNGLGLYMVKAIVETGGGRVWFESIVDEGTTFYLALPVQGMHAQKGTKKLTDQS